MAYGRRVPKLGPNDWIRAAQRCLAEEGIDSVRVEPLAKALGVSKGSFYWHFKDRRSLIEAMLEVWEEEATLAIIAEVEALSGRPEDRLRSLMLRTLRAPLDADRFESALRGWASQDEVAQKTLRRVDRRRLGYVTELLEEAGVSRASAQRRAHILYRTLVGEFMMRSTGEKGLSRAAIDELHNLLLPARR